MSHYQGKSIPLVIFTDREGFKVPQEAQQFLNSIKTNIAVISVAGKYRTGKSYLLNRVILDLKGQPGFGVGPTINPCTKGIWVWDPPIMTQTQDGEDLAVLILDSEGLGAFDEDANHDTRIFMLALLLGSYFIYNSVGTIDENALQTLSLVVNLTKQLQIRANDSDLDVDEVAEYFPSFLWVLRDFMLQLVDSNGSKITAKQYLENSLQPQRGLSDNVENKNRIRRLLTHFFNERDCFPMIRPSEDERILQTLEQTPDNELRPEFVRQVDTLRRLIFRKLKPKMVNGRQITGEMLCVLAQSYTDSINKGGVPVIEGAWNSVCNSECEKLMYDCVKNYDNQIRSQIQGPLGDDQLESLHQEVFRNIQKAFKKNQLGTNIEQYEAQMVKKIEEKFETIKVANNRKNAENCEKLFNELGNELSDLLKTGSFKDFDSFKVILDGKIAQFQANLPKNESAFAKLKELTDKIQAEAMEFINRNKMIEQINQNRRLAEELEFVENQLKQKKDEMQEEKQKYQDKIDSLQKELSQQKANLTGAQMKIDEILYEKERAEKLNQERLNSVKSDLQYKYTKLKQKYNNLKSNYDQHQQNCQKETIRLNNKLQLLDQDLEFKQRECSDLERRSSIAEQDLKEARAQLRLLREQLQQKENSTNLNAQMVEGVDQAMFRQYMDSIKGQLDDYRNYQQEIIGVLQSKKQSKKTIDPNQQLSEALDRLEQRNQDLENQCERLERYQRIFQNSSAILCKICGKQFNSTVFFAHLTLCIKKKEANNSESSTIFHIVISQCVIKETPDNKTIPEYVISVTNRQNRSWNITRTYAMFQKLHQNLSEEFQDLQLPDKAKCNGLKEKATSAIFNSTNIDP